MLESKALVLARVEVPFEIWIILVVCTGGIYLLIAIFRREPDARASKKQVEVDLVELLTEVMSAVLSEQEEEKLKRIWSKYPVLEEQRTQIVLMSKIALSEFFSTNFDDQTTNKVKDSLVSRGLSEGMASELMGAIARAMTAPQTPNEP
jgi:hypothetical protein